MPENMKTKIGYGLKENVSNAISEGLLDSGDIIFTSNPGSEEVGFVKPDGSVVYIKGRPLNEIFDSLESGNIYISTSEAYEGQTIKAKLEDGKYHTYTIQPNGGGFILEEIGANVKQYVNIGTRPGSGQEQGIIYIENNVGYIWNGSDWVKIFEDVSADITDIKGRLSTVETGLTEKAPIANPAFTGSVTIEGSPAATQEWVNTLVGQLSGGVPGIVDSTDNPLPSTGYKAGQMWRVAAEGTYAGVACEIGDLIICLKDYNEGSASNADFMVVQANIDGAVTGANASTDGHIVVFNGATGKVIKDSNVAIASLNDAITKAHEHTNKTQLDSFTKTQEEILSEAHDDAASQISTVQTTLEESIATKADASNVYSKTDIDDKLNTINQNLNTKVDAATVDGKIETAKTETLEEAAEAVSAKIGDLGESQTVVEYVTKVVGSGGTDVAEQIDEALAQAKAYTDQSLTITEF